ncbi:MAG: GNAT family N-acetyltransferase [Polyangiaceae bacterium]
MSRFVAKELFESPELLDGLVELFERTGSVCFCRYWHFSGDKNDWQARCAFDREVNRTEFVEAARQQSDEARGLVAVDTEHQNLVVGWLKVAPARSLKKMVEQRYYRSLPTLQGEREGVFTVGCALVDPAYRHQRIAHHLVEAAVVAVRRWGGHSIEAMPRVPAAPPVPDEEIFTGPRAAFDAAGFVCVEGMDSYPILRRSV